MLLVSSTVDRGPLRGKALKSEGGAVDVLEWFRYAQRNIAEVNKEYSWEQNVEISGEDQPGFPLLAPGRK